MELSLLQIVPILIEIPTLLTTLEHLGYYDIKIADLSISGFTFFFHLYRAPNSFNRPVTLVK